MIKKKVQTQNHQELHWSCFSGILPRLNLFPPNSFSSSAVSLFCGVNDFPEAAEEVPVLVLPKTCAGGTEELPDTEEAEEGPPKPEEPPNSEELKEGAPVPELLPNPPEGAMKPGGCKLPKPEDCFFTGEGAAKEKEAAEGVEEKLPKPAEGVVLRAPKADCFCGAGELPNPAVPPGGALSNPLLDLKLKH
ncbi:UNVERIFIED_CONTAM: hypothetical protein FKN15_029351 [Acipenser sinensis]